jgi:hypothetical protein
LLNGVVDADGVRFCFVPVVDGGEQPLDEPPLPASLSFGSHVVLSTLGTIDLRTTDVHPYLVLGGTGANAATSCKQLLESRGADAASAADAGAPFALSLPLLPAGTLSDPRSYLAVATGCAQTSPPPDAGRPDGGDAADGSDSSDGADGSDRSDDGGLNVAAMCGTGPGSTTLGLSLVRLSRRINFTKIGFQTVNASHAASPASLLVEQSGTQVSIFFSDTLVLGQISPRNQPGLVAKGDFGAALPGASLFHVQPPAGTGAFPEFLINWATLLSTNGATEDDIVEGANFTFVLLGAQPGQNAGTRGHPFRIKLIENAPDVARD